MALILTISGGVSHSAPDTTVYTTRTTEVQNIADMSSRYIQTWIAKKNEQIWEESTVILEKVCRRAGIKMTDFSLPDT